jgi:DNA-binding LytR/AlgR family response regulator
MKKITCIIIEDEPVSQDLLIRYIADYPVLELLAVCRSAIEAGSFLHGRRPDLIFLDITMPGISGLDFYKTLADPPLVIFTTAYPEYAVSGFEVNAVDYLVKPFPFDRFLKAVSKVQELLRTPADEADDFLLLPVDKKFQKVNHHEICFAEAMGDYVKVHGEDKTWIVHYTLQKLQELLPAKLFFRVHKSYIISLQRMEYIEGNRVFACGKEVPIGQTYRNDFLNRLQRRENKHDV